MNVWTRTKAGVGAILVTIALLSAPAFSETRQKTTHNYRADLGATSPELDVYSADTAKDAPVLVYVHGGAWVKGTRNAVHDKHRHFLGLGFVFVSLDYRLVPDVTVADQFGDIDAALGWVQENIGKFGGDPDNLHLMGHSAGAHLVAMTGVAPGPVGRQLIDEGALRSVIANDTSAYDIPRIATALGGTTLPPLYRRAFGTDPDTWRKISPQHQLDSAQNLPDFLLLYSGKGWGIPADEFAQSFAADLRKAGGRADVFDGSAYTHREINTGIGKTTDITNAIDGFLANKT
ncbi:MAG: alpha/beta hydrolase [Marinosulfonomonas sp.]|nr:alpha/beta hydrolase [Marinosulfonomonas sp.]